MREKLVDFLEDRFGSLTRFPEQELEVDGVKMTGVRVVGNDDCFDGNEFYQYVLGDETIYKAYFDMTNPETGEDYEELDQIDYTKAYRIENITEQIIESL